MNEKKFKSYRNNYFISIILTILCNNKLIQVLGEPERELCYDSYNEKVRIIKGNTKKEVDVYGDFDMNSYDENNSNRIITVFRRL